MRGTNSNHVKILVDGIDVTDPSTPTGTFDLQHLLLADIDRIEVLRGPQSGLYGSDAIGGAIYIVTKTGSGPLSAIASLEGGSFGTFNQTDPSVAHRRQQLCFQCRPLPFHRYTGHSA